MQQSIWSSMIQHKGAISLFIDIDTSELYEKMT